MPRRHNAGDIYPDDRRYHEPFRHPDDGTLNAGENTYDDAELESQIMGQFARDERIDPRAIEVHVKHGRATLSGQVRNDDEREAAANLALELPGIREVSNELSVSGG